MKLQMMVSTNQHLFLSPLEP